MQQARQDEAMIQRRLLVVDDEIDFCVFVARVGSRMGYAVEVATDAKGFKETVPKFQPETIILDINMPDADGIELIQWLAAKGIEARVVVATGGDPQFAKIIEIIGSVRGISSVTTLLKPISIADLQAVLSAPPSGAVTREGQANGAGHPH